MIRTGQFASVAFSLFLLATLPGCSDEQPAKDGPDVNAITGGKVKSGKSTDSTGTPQETGHEGHSHGPESSAGGGSSDSDAPDPFDLKPIVMAKIPPRETLAGRWLLRLMQHIPAKEEGAGPQLGERPVMLLSVVPEAGDETGAVRTLATADQQFSGTTIAKSQATEGRVTFTSNNRDDAEAFNFEGIFVDGVVIGSLEFPNGTVLPARLVPTDEKTLARIEQFDPFDELPEFIKVQQSLVPAEDAKQFAKDHPTSPLARVGLLGIIESLMIRKSPTEDLKPMLEAALADQKRWGERCERQTRFQVLQMMEQTSYNPEFALSYIKDLEKLPRHETVGEFEESMLNTLRQRIKFRAAYNALQSPEAETRKLGVQYAREVLQVLPYNVGMLLALADHLRKEGQPEAAIPLLAEIKALPMQELILRRAFASDPVQRMTPSQRLTELWTSTGRKDDMHDFCMSIYDKKLLSFRRDEKTVEERPEGKGNLVVLAEVFTSSNSPDSVAADLVLSALQKDYSDTMFVALRYHQHSHAPDPLANDTAEGRCFNFYQFSGSPFFLLNGRAVGGIQGTMEHTEPLYRKIKKLIAAELSDETEITVGLSANRQAESVQIQAQVEGADLSNQNLRLRIALTESEIAYTGINGIHRHDMVVRTMPGGYQGVKAIDGVLKFDGTVNLTELKQELDSYLIKFEQTQGQPLPGKPLDLKNLHVVAFVQDDSTRKVLQTAVVPLNVPDPK